MSALNFSWGDEIIDSRDIISRYDELTGIHNDLTSALEAAGEDLNEFIKETSSPDFIKNEDDALTLKELNAEVKNAQDFLSDFLQSDDWYELKLLEKVVRYGEESPDWSYGETLIHKDYFTDYTKQLIEECYELPKEFEEGTWPWNHMEMDWDGAAEEAKSDYIEITVDGQTYYIRG